MTSSRIATSRKRPRTRSSSSSSTSVLRLSHDDDADEDPHTNTLQQRQAAAVAKNDPVRSSRSTTEEQSSTTTTTPPPPPTPTPPRILTHAVIPTLSVTALDASDALELYYLTRPTVLHAFGNVIRVTKVALGLRYRPRTSTSSSSRSGGATEKEARTKPLELTLEYGAGRAGDELWHESLPSIVVGDDDPNDLRVTWDNEAKVYYTERIDQQIYTTANYLASLSGTVTTKFLQSAVDLLLTVHPGESSSTANKNNNNNRPRQRRRRPPHGRYQPLSVSVVLDNNTTTTTTPLTILRSSSDVDFIQELYHILAELGVELQPVIVPQQAHIVLHAGSSITKVAVGVDVAPHVPALFYQTLYQCIQSIVTADGSVYNNNNNNLVSPATNSNNNNNNTTEAAATNSTPPRQRQRDLLESQTQPTSPRATLGEATAAPGVDPTHAPLPTTPVVAETAATTGTDVNDTVEPPADANNNNNNNINDMDLPPDHTTQAQEAATAAQQAQQAAAEANTPETAQAAAQQAASAAQQAANITTQQAATMAQQALTSGDATAMLYTISRLCLHDPMYGLATPAPAFTNDTTTANTTTTGSTSSSGSSSSSSSSSNYNSSVTAYIYWDGAFYYRVNLVPPYLSIRTEAQILPPPPVAGLSREDVVDWTIFVGLVMITVLGLLLLLQQICGLRLGLPKLYHYQRWFFQPRQYSLCIECLNDDDNDNDDDDDDASRYGKSQHPLRRRGQGKAFPFGQDAIPLSMGGQSVANVLRHHWDDYSPWWRQRQYSDLSGTSHNNDMSDHPNNGNDYDEDGSEHEMFLGDFGVGDLEMVAPTSNGIAEMVLGTSNHEGVNGDNVSQPLPSSRHFRDPNLVDLPDLTSSSKVAVPVSIAHPGNH